MLSVPGLRLPLPLLSLGVCWGDGWGFKSHVGVRGFVQTWLRTPLSGCALTRGDVCACLHVGAGGCAGQHSREAFRMAGAHWSYWVRSSKPVGMAVEPLLENLLLVSLATCVCTKQFVPVTRPLNLPSRCGRVCS